MEIIIIIIIIAIAIAIAFYGKLRHSGFSSLDFTEIVCF
jgi:hypothetical protein